VLEDVTITKRCRPPLRDLIQVSPTTQSESKEAWNMESFFTLFSSHATIPLFTVLIQGGLDLTHRKVMLDTKTLKITCDYPFIYCQGVDWT
jgi:hypothetical protein